ncbi:hypothetical protein AWB73_03604 [Caballeronia turbans]|jgi:hypothetical protein|uniref:hypothetical protein n=1 Tax=unclassified Caballeronia TaxID=2646786 RepID=UPI00074B4D7B|nr:MULTISPECIES: hypothetical protein [unclassified Caballeronia]SAL36572.1 hypothetical protein AWB73_03604 [Caballeronia turbans]
MPLMSHYLLHYWHILSVRLDASRERRMLREARRAMQACACGTPTHRDDEASRAERLECIALFAQAGYFNMGNAVDLFQPPPPF